MWNNGFSYPLWGGKPASRPMFCVSWSIEISRNMCCACITISRITKHLIACGCISTSGNNHHNIVLECMNPFRTCFDLIMSAWMYWYIHHMSRFGFLRVRPSPQNGKAESRKMFRMLGSNGSPLFLRTIFPLNRKPSYRNSIRNLKLLV